MATILSLIHIVMAGQVGLNFTDFINGGIIRVAFNPYTSVIGNFTWGIMFGFIGAGLYANERSIGTVLTYLVLVGIFFSIIFPASIVFLFGLILAFMLTVVFYLTFVKKKTY